MDRMDIRCIYFTQTQSLEEELNISGVRTYTRNSNL